MDVDFNIEEVKLLAIFDELLKETKSNIDAVYTSFIPFDEEPSPDYTPSEEKTVEFKIVHCNFYVDIEFKNEGFNIVDIELMDDRDNSIKYETLRYKLLRNLEIYSISESRNISSSYNQAKDILSDQNEYFGLKQDAPTWIDNRNKYKDTILKLCHKPPSDKEIDNLFQCGTFGRRIKTRASYQIIVNNMIPLIDKDVFAPVIGQRSNNTSKARFLESIFDGHPYTNYQKGLSNIA